MKLRAIWAAVLGVCVVVMPGRVQAVEQVNPAFGGRILVSFYCACSNTQFVSVFDMRQKRPVLLNHLWGVSRLNMGFNLWTPGVQTLGTYIRGAGVCLVYDGESCTLVPTEGMITPAPLSGVGTGTNP